MQRYPGMENKQPMIGLHTTRTYNGWNVAAYLSIDSHSAFTRPHRWRYGSFRPASWMDGVEPPYAPQSWYEGDVKAA